MKNQLEFLHNKALTTMMFSLEKQQKFMENKQKQQQEEEEKLKKTVVTLVNQLDNKHKNKEETLSNYVTTLKTSHLKNVENAKRNLIQGN